MATFCPIVVSGTQRCGSYHQFWLHGSQPGVKNVLFLGLSSLLHTTAVLAAMQHKFMSETVVPFMSIG